MKIALIVGAALLIGAAVRAALLIGAAVGIISSLFVDIITDFIVREE